jgi:nicotinate (nicotinamide) nucleotide adenylyltransferase
MNDFIKEHDSAILIFGTFNPVTIAHINIGLKAGEMIPDSDVIYVPAKDEFLRNWKGFSEDSIVRERVTLLEKAAERYGFKVCHAELDGIVDGKTVNTIEYMKNTVDYTDICLCMGTDKVGELGTWYKGEELVSQNKFIIFERGATADDVMDDLTRKYKDNFTFVKEDPKYVDISATDVRNALSEGDLVKVRALVPDEVYEFLADKADKRHL